MINNELRGYSTNEENLKVIEDFMRKNFKHCTIDRYNYDITVRYESEKNFPDPEVKELLEILPDKRDIYLDCLTADWDSFFCVFYTVESGEWEIAPCYYGR
jgi:hypothetical protein